MPIVSISLTEEILKEIDNLQKSMGFLRKVGCNSELASEALSRKKSKMQNLSGSINAILLVVHNDEYDDQVNGIKHSFEDLITTHMHSKIEGEKMHGVVYAEG